MRVSCQFITHQALGKQGISWNKTNGQTSELQLRMRDVTNINPCGRTSLQFNLNSPFIPEYGFHLQESVFSVIYD